MVPPAKSAPSEQINHESSMNGNGPSPCGITTLNLWKSFRNQLQNNPDHAPEVDNELSRVQAALSDKMIDDDDDDSTQTEFSFSTTSTAPSNRNSRPNRWVDFFCIVGPSRVQQSSKDATEDSLTLKPTLLDTYPKRRKDMEFPQHMPVFCFPSGCRAVRINKSSAVRNIPEPSISSMVLTSSVGHRLYLTVLTIYEKEEEPHMLFRKRSHCSTDDDDEDEQGQGVALQYFTPKCLVLLSHYAFFHAQTIMLKEILYTVQSGSSPIPLERMVAHIMDDIPLPPLGRLRVEWRSWMPPSTRRPQLICLERPAPNNPFVSILQVSFQPLVRVVSVPNILIMWATLLQEGRLILSCSCTNVALLTPIAEALLSLLFPLEWQGMYIPVLPNHMQDVLEAPVPYLVGTTARLNEFQHPAGVTVYDLDDDILHLGFTDDGYIQQCLPELPQKASRKLREKLLQSAAPWYLPSERGVMGQVTIGNQGTCLEKSYRPSYAATKRVGVRNPKPTPRKYILGQASKVLPTVEELKPEDFQVSNRYRPQRLVREESKQDHTREATFQSPGTASTENLETEIRRKHEASFQKRADDFIATISGQGTVFSRNTPMSPIVASDGTVDVLSQQDEIAAHLLEVDEHTAGLAKTIRSAFLNFFVDTLAGYQDFLGPKTDKLDISRFVANLNMSTEEQVCMQSVVQTQMFERFLQGKDKSNLFRRRYLDEQIIRLCPKRTSTDCLLTPLPFPAMFMNVSMPSNPLGLFRMNNVPPTPKETLFLDSTKWQVSKTLVIPFPCGIGVSHGQATGGDRRFPNRLRREECVTAHTIPFWKAVLDGAFCSGILSCP